MRIPRDWSGDELIKRLGRLGYAPTRQREATFASPVATIGAIIILRCLCMIRFGIGTLNAILRDLADRLNLLREEVLHRLM